MLTALFVLLAFSSCPPLPPEAQRFECTGCGDCCRVEGDVWLNSQEIDAALESTNLTEVAFAAEYCDAAILPTPSSPSQRGSSGPFLRLRHATPGGGCALLDEEQKCSIYEARPLQCSTYPFWPRLLHSPQNWAAEASACEGIQPSAPEIDVPVATRQAEEWAAWLRRFPADSAAAADDARRWITDFVVPLSLCPYASAAAETTRVSVSRSTTPTSLAADVTSEARRLLLTPSVPTALVAAPAFTDLSEFLDIIYSLDESTGDPDLDGAILIAPFHPSFAFAGVDPASALHYEKRSPLPLVSILRAEDVEAIGGEEATARIAAANEEALLGRNRAEVAEIFKRLGRSGG